MVWWCQFPVHDCHLLHKLVWQQVQLDLEQFSRGVQPFSPVTVGTNRKCIIRPFTCQKPLLVTSHLVPQHHCQIKIKKLLFNTLSNLDKFTRDLCRPLTSGVARLLDSAATIQWQVVDHQEVLTVTLDVELLRCNSNTSAITSEKAYVHVRKHLHIWSDKIPECGAIVWYAIKF